MNRILARIALIFGALAIITWTGLYLSSPIDNSELFTITKGESIASITSRLKDEGYIRSRLFFRIALQESDYATRIQPGTHDLSGARSYKEIIQMLASGNLMAGEIVLRVLEGWDLRDIAKELSRLNVATEEEFYDVVGRPAGNIRDNSLGGGSFVTDSIPYLLDKPSNVSLEGYLFPDTYRVYADSSAEDIVSVMLNNFVRRMRESRVVEEAIASGKSLFDVVTMASIIENEVRGDEDRRIVADIFWRRLDAGMPLQADSTVNYITGKGHPAVSYDDTRLDSPYNTYRYPGLPLGPISNPGLSALEAAVNPEPNAYWYFLTDSEGAVHYGKTLDEHNRNKRKYLY